MRRLAGLIILGISHGLLFFPGDILVSYGILGLIFLALRKQSTRVLIFTAAFCFCLSAAAYTLLGLFSQTAPAFPAMNYLGSFGDAVRSNTRIYPLSLGFVALFNVPSAFAFFSLGFLAMREGWFPRLRFSRKSVGLLATGVMGSAFYASATAFQWKPLLPWAMLILAMTAPLLTTAYVHALLSWLASGKNARFFYAVAQAGRMSLTNYLLQSVLAGLLFHGYGFALYNRYSIAALIPVSLGIFTAEILFSLLWLRFFRYGPAEWLLRCFARWQPVALLR